MRISVGRGGRIRASFRVGKHLGVSVPLGGVSGRTRRSNPSPSATTSTGFDDYVSPSDPDYLAKMEAQTQAYRVKRLAYEAAAREEMARLEATKTRKARGGAASGADPTHNTFNRRFGEERRVRASRRAAHMAPASDDKDHDQEPQIMPAKRRWPGRRARPRSSE
jgi:hypothetical protein